MKRLTEWYDDGEYKGVMVKEERGEHVLKTLFDELDEGYLGMCELKAYEDTGLTPPEICSIATELKEYHQLGLSPKRLSEHVAFCNRYRELFGAIDFNSLLELKERDKSCKVEINAGVPRCPVCGRKVVKCYDFCPDCGQRLEQ